MIFGPTFNKRKIVFQKYTYVFRFTIINRQCVQVKTMESSAVCPYLCFISVPLKTEQSQRNRFDGIPSHTSFMWRWSSSKKWWNAHISTDKYQAIKGIVVAMAENTGALVIAHKTVVYNAVPEYLTQHLTEPQAKAQQQLHGAHFYHIFIQNTSRNGLSISCCPVAMQLPLAKWIP